MKRSIYGLLGSGIAGLLFAAAASAAEPVPVLDFDFSKYSRGMVKDASPSGLDLHLGKAAVIQNGALVLTPKGDSFAAADQTAFKAWAKKMNVNEMAASFWIRFDKTLFGGGSNASTASLGLFDCSRDADGHICITVFPKKTELLDPVVMKSKITAEFGKWYHVEFSYSMNERRYKLYVDGSFQMENDNLLMPLPAVRELKLGNGFRGAVKNLKFYNAALGSEELALSDASDSAYDDLKTTADAVAASAKNPDLKAWAQTLSKRAVAYKADKTTTVAAYKRLSKAAANLKTLSDGVADPAKTVADKPVTAYVTPATTQALYLPYDLPENGKLTNQINVIMAQNEFEPASVIIVPFRPIRHFTLKMGDLRNGKNVLNGSDVDIKLVKRWFRTGGAWMAYHVDLYMRVLTPDMLLNDDKIITVDEFRHTNQMLMHYPGGSKYQEVSDFAYVNRWLRGIVRDYFYDAPTLQPLELKEAGRNQQYIVTFHAPKGTAPGFYKGKLQMLADGKDAGVLNVTVRVLPFELPQPRAYYNTGKSYISHINSYRGPLNTIKNAMDHNLMHMTGTAGTVDALKESIRLGYPLEINFNGQNCGIPKFGGPADQITPALNERMEKMAVADVLRWEKVFEKMTGLKNYTNYKVWTSEAGWYGAISTNPDRISRLLNERTHLKLFSHGMTDDLPFFSPGIYDMDCSSSIIPMYARIWHAADGRTLNYGFPFPGPENPGLMRRCMGLELYKANQYDGHMMHGYVDDQFNEFTKYPGGDGDYRTFCLAYPQKGGCINRIAIVGVREGYDDVRYSTFMKMQAEKALRTSKDELVVREAKRQLAWLERVDGDLFDMDDFRTNVQYRILTLQNLIKERGGK